VKEEGGGGERKWWEKGESLFLKLGDWCRVGEKNKPQGKDR